jgi:hypothetical protein
MRKQAHASAKAGKMRQAAGQLDASVAVELESLQVETGHNL